MSLALTGSFAPISNPLIHNELKVLSVNIKKAFSNGSGISCFGRQIPFRSFSYVALASSTSSQRKVQISRIYSSFVVTHKARFCTPECTNVVSSFIFLLIIELHAFGRLAIMDYLFHYSSSILFFLKLYCAFHN